MGVHNQFFDFLDIREFLTNFGNFLRMGPRGRSVDTPLYSAEIVGEAGSTVSFYPDVQSYYPTVQLIKLKTK